MHVRLITVPEVMLLEKKVESMNFSKLVSAPLSNFTTYSSQKC
jgi:hypothetical protein